MKTTLTLNGEGKKATINVTDADNQVFNTLVDIALTYTGTSKVTTSGKQINNPKQEQVKSTPVKNISEQILLLPEEIREWYSEQIKLADSKQEPGFFHTGIKFKESEPKFKVRYACPNCFNKGQQYESLDAKDTLCHNCGSIIDITQVKKFPFPDQYNNFFVSNRLKGV